MKLILYGKPVTKKNSQRLITVKGRTIPIPSKAYKEYEASCLEQIRYIYGDVEPIRGQVSISCMYYLPDERKRDLANLLEATQDILVAAGVIADDDNKHLAPISNVDWEIDRENPRVEITLTQRP